MNTRFLGLSMLSCAAILLGGCGSDSEISLGTGGTSGDSTSSSGSMASSSGNNTSSSSSSGSGGAGGGGSSSSSSGSVSSSSSSSSSSSGGTTEKFSFFVTSLAALQDLSGSAQGFGGDLRFGETGPGAGLRGADKICATIAERSMPGAGQKPWRAFLSAVADENGKQVDAKDRIGDGPWYDRLGRLLAANKTDLLTERPTGADPAIINDFPNEDGVPNHQPDPNQGQVDNHDMLTGTSNLGTLYGPKSTCLDWTSNLGNLATEGKPRVGHSWPRNCPNLPPGSPCPMRNWMSSLDESGCAPGVNLIEMGPPSPTSTTVGSGGGYGGFYCFSLVP